MKKVKTKFGYSTRTGGLKNTGTKLNKTKKLPDAPDEDHLSSFLYGVDNNQ